MAHACDYASRPRSVKLDIRAQCKAEIRKLRSAGWAEATIGPYLVGAYGHMGLTLKVYKACVASNEAAVLVRGMP